jgi:hypothetical protein
LRRFRLPDGAEFIDESLHDGRPYPGFHARARKVASLPYLYSDEHRLTAAGRVLLDIQKARGRDLSDAYRALRDRLAGAAGFGHHGVNCHVFTPHESPEEQAAEAKGGTHHEWMVLLTLGSEGKLGFQFGAAGTPPLGGRPAVSTGAMDGVVSTDTLARAGGPPSCAAPTVGDHPDLLEEGRVHAREPRVVLVHGHQVFGLHVPVLLGALIREGGGADRKWITALQGIGPQGLVAARGRRGRHVTFGMP